MKKILLATPHMPPTPGGPSTHAKKLVDHFGFPLFNFEKYKKFPSGIRHLLAFGEIFVRSIGKDTILALDGFSVALPSIFVGKILNKKVIVRIGGDFIYEQFLYTKEVDLENFYQNFNEYYKSFSKPLKVKYKVQKYILQNADQIIFNTKWQKDICEKHCSLKQTLFVIDNPVEPIEKSIFQTANTNDNFEKAREENKFIFTSITRDIPYKNLPRLKHVFSTLREGVYLETAQGSWESCLKRISLSRVYICASISDISPNQVLEAISLRVPVIITKYCGLTNILATAGVARFIDPFSEEDIKMALEEMCDENKYLEYKKALETFTWQQTWQTLFTQYEEILKK